MAVKTNEPQAGFWDREIEAPEVEEAIERMLANEEAHKQYAKDRRAVSELVEVQDLKEGERLRVGQHIIVGRRRSGGGFDVPTWSKASIGRIESVRSG